MAHRNATDKLNKDNKVIIEYTFRDNKLMVTVLITNW